MKERAIKSGLGFAIGFTGMEFFLRFAELGFRGTELQTHLVSGAVGLVTLGLVWWLSKSE